MRSQELSHETGDLIAVFFQGEVSGVEQMKLQILQIFLVCLGAGSGEDLIVLSPDDEPRRLVLTEVVLPFLVQ